MGFIGLPYHVVGFIGFIGLRVSKLGACEVRSLSCYQLFDA